MKLLEERILQEGQVRPGHVLKVDCFLNHQLDVELLDKIGEEFFDRVFARVGEERMQEAMSLIREIISAMEAELQKNGKEKGECK